MTGTLQTLLAITLVRNKGRINSEKIVPVKHTHAKLRALGDNEDNEVK